jgi:catechol 2,3-dioxygenase-like lactoylglutathione lyase family enzyme
MEQRFSFITLGVADLDRAEAFYRALGWAPSSYGEGKGIVFFQLPGIVFSLFPREELAHDAQVADSKPGFSGVTLSYNTRTQAEVDAILAEAVAAGAVVTKPAGKASWGGYMAYFTDLDGHLWEVCYNPHAELGPEGQVTIPA